MSQEEKLPPSISLFFPGTLLEKNNAELHEGRHFKLDVCIYVYIVPYMYTWVTMPVPIYIYIYLYSQSLLYLLIECI